MTRIITETITIAGLHPDLFDPATHTGLLEQKIAERHGPGWTLLGVIDGVAHAQRTVTIREPEPITAEWLNYVARFRQLRDAAQEIRGAGHLGNLLVGGTRHDNLKWARFDSEAGTLTYTVEAPFVHDGRRYSKGQSFVHQIIAGAERAGATA